MPIATLRLNPGVNTEMTPALNEAGIASSNLIRFMNGLPEKYGGWASYQGISYGSQILALWAWDGLIGDQYLAVGTIQSLNVVSSGLNSNITPQTFLQSADAPSLSTTNTSKNVTINIANSVVTTDSAYVVVNIPIAIGGIIIYGIYAITASTSTTVTVVASSAATATVTNGGTTPTYTTVGGTNSISVALTAHGQSVGNTVEVNPAITVGGLTLFGPYQVITVPDANHYTIQTIGLAPSSATASQNSGNMYNLYYASASIGVTGGYSIGGYGQGGYGQGGSVTNPFSPITATDWTFGNWGNQLIACAAGGPIYYWSPSAPLPLAQIIAGAPIINDGIVIAVSQQMIMAWGSSFGSYADPLLLRWCDVSNYNTWVASSTNQAGSYRIPTGSKIVAVIQGPTGMLLWTDVDLWQVQYIGPPLVFGFTRLAAGCGLISRHAVGILGSTVYWMSQAAFFSYSSATGVQEAPSSVRDAVFQNLFNGTINAVAAPNSYFNEFGWFFPSAQSAGINDSYVKFNTVEGTWDFGSLGRSAWINQSVLGPPIAGDQGGNVWQHETGFDAGTGNAMLPSFTTGYFAIQEGADVVFIDRIIPDFKYLKFSGSIPATLSITVYTVYYPDDVPTVYGPFPITSTTRWIDCRIRGRLAAFQISSSDVGTWWRFGALRHRWQPDGRL